MISMQDIADAVGVSKATVSLALNGKNGSRVSEKVRQKVLAAASEMGYQINDLARGLRTGRTNLISILVTDISDDFFGTMSSHIQEEAGRHGYLVITANTNGSDDDLISMLSLLARKKVDGIIVSPTIGCRDALSSMMERGMPIVQTDRYVDGLDAPYVGSDNYESTCNALEELISTGRKDIAMITLDPDVSSIIERRKGYEDTLRAHGCFRPELVKAVATGDIDRVKTAITEIIIQSPDAVFFSSRAIFTLAMETMSPEYISSDIKFLCFDRVKSYKSILNDKLWYIDQPVEEMAKMAFSILMSAMDQEPTDSVVRFASTLVK